MAYQHKPTIELTTYDDQNKTTFKIEISSENPEQIDQLRKKVAKVLIDEWAGMDYELSCTRGLNVVLPNTAGC